MLVGKVAAVSPVVATDVGSSSKRQRVLEEVMAGEALIGTAVGYVEAQACCYSVGCWHYYHVTNVISMELDDVVVVLVVGVLTVFTSWRACCWCHCCHVLLSARAESGNGDNITG